MERDFMVALLSASRFLVWHRCHVDASSLRILFTGKGQPPVKQAIFMPETAIDEYSSQIAGRAGDTPIHARLGTVGQQENLSMCWHSVYRTG